MASSPTKPHGINVDDDVLIGTGDRVVKLGFVTINVYSLGVHVDAKACRSALQQEYGDLDHDGLLRHSSFYSDFAQGLFKKAFRLKFCRSILKQKLVDGFAEPLKSRCDEAHQEDANLLLSKLVPPEGVVEGDVLSLVCHGDGKTLTGLHLPAGGNTEQELITIESGGAGGAWLALQNIYFDDNTALPTIRHSAVADLPNVLMEETTSRKEPSAREIEVAVEEDLTRTKKTWSEFAGRDPAKGGHGYKFGDFSRGVVTALGMRKSFYEKQSASKSFSRHVSLPNHDENLDKLQNQVERLELKNQELQQELERTEQRLVEANRELPFQFAAAFALAEAIYILLGSLTHVYIPSLTKFQMYTSVMIGLAGWKYISEKRHRH